MQSYLKACLLGGISMLASVSGTAYAQEGAESADAPGDIIVTARKRDETSIAVPVAISAVSGADLQRRGMARLENLTTVVPQLQLGTAGGTVQGGYVAIRGVAGSDNNPFADQAVSFNIDGVQVSRANIRRMAEMDIGQVEVLRGPQALFFGKNSPGGVISLRSADPTQDLQARASAGYEFNAREWRGDGFISGPLTETLGARLAVFGTTMRGWFENEVDGSNEFRDSNRHTPKTKEFAVRGTLKWEPNDVFNARFKASYNHINDDGALTSMELMDCPQGAPQLGGGPENCKLDGKGVRLRPGALIGSLSERFADDGDPYLRMEQALLSHEMNYRLSDVLNLTSVTGYYYLKQRLADDFNNAWNPDLGLPSANVFGNKEFSQEVRLASSYEGPANFLVGGYYQKSKIYTGSTTFFGLQAVNGVNPTQVNNFLLNQTGEAFSWFGQVTVKPVDQLEISAGGRYSYERKRLTNIESQIGSGPGPLPRVVIPENPAFRRKNSWSDFSPEFTVSYRPTRDLNVFVSRKRGFLSGGFNSGASNFNSDLSFDQQVIKGWEGGLKAALLNGALRTNLTLYDYKITGLQVSTSVTGPTGVPVQRVVNAGKTGLKGAEFDFTYSPMKGLTLRGAVGYNDAKYDVFAVNCYAGQTQEMGCNYPGLNGSPGFTSTVINGTTYTTYSQQNLAGQPLLRAPKWSGSAGVNYEADLGASLRFGVNADMNFSSSYFAAATNAPSSVIKSYQMLDAGARIGAQNNSWELALIGRNLTDKYFGIRANDQPRSGGGTGRAANDPRGSFLGDMLTSVNRGREVMLRLTVNYGR